jgi:hypothetical protein
MNVGETDLLCTMRVERKKGACSEGGDSSERERRETKKRKRTGRR